MRRAGRIDPVQRDIVRALRAAGCSVQPIQSTSASDKGVPDLLVGRGQINYVLEVKTPGEHLNDAQVEWHNRWRGKMPAVVRSVDEALRACEVWK